MGADQLAPMPGATGQHLSTQSDQHEARPPDCSAGHQNSQSLPAALLGVAVMVGIRPLDDRSTRDVAELLLPVMGHVALAHLFDGRMVIFGVICIKIT